MIRVPYSPVKASTYVFEKYKRGMGPRLTRENTVYFLAFYLMRIFVDHAKKSLIIIDLLESREGCSVREYGIFPSNIFLSNFVFCRRGAKGAR